MDDDEAVKYADIFVNNLRVSEWVAWDLDIAPDTSILTIRYWFSERLYNIFTPLVGTDVDVRIECTARNEVLELRGRLRGLTAHHECHELAVMYVTLAT